jgi:hypothetical protein
MSGRGDTRCTRDTVLDLVLYAPIGLALDARSVVPNLATRGRDQVSLLRVVAQLALRKSEADARRRLHEMAPQTAAPPASDDAAAASDDTEPAGTTDVVSPPGPPMTDTDAVDQPAPPAEHELPIPGYDSLGASQIVPRLGTLDAHELEAVRIYESAHRNRRTILNRIAQLGAG